jgi:hypothetical protein
MSEPQHWVIDGIEEQVAAIELPDGEMIHLPAKLLPKDAKPGQILRVTLELDPAATKRALDESAAQVKKTSDASRKRDPGGDITL